MFYLNSNDSSTVPDSLFFLQKIGLLKHQLTDQLQPEDLYFFENDIAQKVYTPDSITTNTPKPKTVLIFDFIFGADLTMLRDQKIIVIPHVYFDYVTTIKDLTSALGPDSFKILTPETNSTLIPKKHLKLTLPFLKEFDFISNTGKMKSAEEPLKIKDSKARLLTLMLKSVLSSLFLFFFKPLVQTKLFFSKYNFRFVFGKFRVGIIKSFYFVYNLRFDLLHAFFSLKQWRYFFYTYNARFVWGKTKMFFINSFHSIAHLIRIGAIRSFYGLRKIIVSFFIFLKYQPVAWLGKCKLFFIKIFYAILNFRFLLAHGIHSIFLFLRYKPSEFFGFLRLFFIKSFYSLYNLRFPIFYGSRSTLIKSFYTIINMRYVVLDIFNKLFSFFRYAPLYYLGKLRVMFIRLFYWFFNLRFRVAHTISAFFWLNYKYTFYPIRKIYWFSEYQIQKRILKTENVSKH